MHRNHVPRPTPRLFPLSAVPLRARTIHVGLHPGRLQAERTPVRSRASAPEQARMGRLEAEAGMQWGAVPVLAVSPRVGCWMEQHGGPQTQEYR